MDECLKEVHGQARDAFLMWRSYNNPKKGLLYETMKSIKANLKLMQWKCQANKDKHACNSRAKKLLELN